MLFATQPLNMKYAAFLFLASLSVSAAQETLEDRAKYGRLVGNITTIKFGVSGTVYAADKSKLVIKGFSYNGEGVDPFFQVKNRGYSFLQEIQHPKHSSEHLDKYENNDIELQLTGGQEASTIEHLYVRSRTNKEVYGHITFNSDQPIPEAKEIDAIKGLRHKFASGKVIIKDSQTLLITNFHYDGTAPRAYFFVGNGTSHENPKTKIPDEKGSCQPVTGHEYTGEDITITLPDNYNVYRIEWLSMWCELFSQDFGHIDIPKPDALNVPPYRGIKIEDTCNKAEPTKSTESVKPSASPKLSASTKSSNSDNGGANRLTLNFLLCAIAISTTIFCRPRRLE